MENFVEDAPLEDHNGAASTALEKINPQEAAALFREMLPPDGGNCQGLLLAVSGGADSIALLGLAAACRAAIPPLFVANLHHGWREEAQQEGEMVLDLAQSFEIPATLLRWEGRLAANHAQAREGRYQHLQAHARTLGLKHLVIAHHQDDQAETVLMRFLRGSGVKGLAGMAMRQTHADFIHLRPFLGIKKPRLIATCEANHWPYISDPSNENPKFMRPRLRRLFEVFAHEGLSSARLVTLAKRAQRADEALDFVANQVFERARLIEPQEASRLIVQLAVAELKEQPFEIVLRVFERAIFYLFTQQAEETKTKTAPALEKLERLTHQFYSGMKQAENKGSQPLRLTLAEVQFTLKKQCVDIRFAPPPPCGFS